MDKDDDGRGFRDKIKEEFREEASALDLDIFRIEAGDGKLKLLIVEDEASLLDILREVFEEENFLVQTASNGSDAVVVADNFKPDIVILDLCLPKKNGFTVGQEIKKKMAPVGVPILVLTAMSDWKSKALESGCCDECLIKPTTLETLRRAVEELLGRGRETGRVVTA